MNSLKRIRLDNVNRNLLLIPKEFGLNNLENRYFFSVSHLKSYKDFGSVTCERKRSSYTRSIFTTQNKLVRFTSTKSESVSNEEIEKFEKMSSSWWDDSNQGLMKELHWMNRLRVPLIRDGLLQNESKERNSNAVPRPLEGFRILDIGCGGGILCEPLGKLGATVKGIDPGKENIAIAERHLPDDLRRNVSYECASIEEFVSQNPDSLEFDAAVMSEVIEHVQNPEIFVQTASQVLKPGGSLFITTLNRTAESWLGAIVAWEYLLRKLPVGTHDWEKFMSPEEVEKILKLGGFRTVLLHGMCYNPITNSWTWTKNRAINYAVHAIKES